jgi:hypothetical protein
VKEPVFSQFHEVSKTDFTNKAAAKGVKPFTMHGALKDSVTDYGFLDRLAM